ncbi:MAG: hypothetical protein QM687_04550 [Ferruginibacter sp.]
MKKGLKYFLSILILLLLGGFIYWQFVKKGVIRNVIEKAVNKGTDSTYYVKYESSQIDEVGGNASFTNIVLQSDSLQQLLYNDDTVSIAREIYNVRVGQLNIKGANIPSFLQKNTVEANSIEIIRPTISIIRTGKQAKIEMSREDSLALYDRLTGKFKSIQAGEIIITDGTVTFANGKKTPHTIIQGINIHLKNLKIDSTRNYDNLLSYFIKDIDANIKSVTTTNQKNGNQFFLETVQYSAPGRFIYVNWILQKDSKTGEVLIGLKDNRITGISTNDFIVNHTIKADTVSSNGGIVSIYRSKKTGAVNEEVELDNDFFDQAQIRNIRLGNTTLNIYNRTNNSGAPVTIKNIQFAVNNIPDVQNGTNLKRLISNSNWNLSGNGVSFSTKNNLYKISVGPFAMDNANSTLRLSKVAVIPLLTEAEFMKRQRFQHDQYNITFNNIVLTGINAQALLNEQKIIAEQASLQTIVKIYNDRTLDFDTSSKIGLYPHQMLYNLKVPVKIKTLKLINSTVSYRERGRLSTQVGEVFFNNINATVTNLCNIKEELAGNNMLTLNATAKFMGLAPLKTTWKLPVNTDNGAFNVLGEIGSFDATKINSITKPLGMANIESGNVKQVRFGMSGDDYRSKGDFLLIYDQLKIKMLKNTGDEKPNIKTKTVTSFIANLIMKDANPSGGKTRAAAIAFERDTQKSFFNLLWKSIFQGTKKVAGGKNDGN